MPDGDSREGDDSRASTDDQTSADGSADAEARTAPGPSAGADERADAHGHPAALADVDLEIRPATHDDYGAVVAFTEDTWSDRDGSDYIPSVYHDWIDKERSATLVADPPGEGLAGVAQVVLLGDDEAWCQGMRVAPAFRGAGVSTALNTALFDWARRRGATVARNMVFSWNTAGLGASRASGFAPCTEFRWATPDPDPGATLPDGFEVTRDPGHAWRYWTDSEARDHLRGLGLALDESWALREVTGETVRRAADETALLAVRSDRGVRGLAYRARDYEREIEDDGDGDGESSDGGTEDAADAGHGDGSEDGNQDQEHDDPRTERRVEYGVGAWADTAAARALFAAVARDAAALDADRTRVLIPETARHVTDASYVRAGVSDEPDFVLAADLTADYPVLD